MLSSFRTTILATACVLAAFAAAPAQESDTPLRRSETPQPAMTFSNEDFDELPNYDPAADAAESRRHLEQTEEEREREAAEAAAAEAALPPMMSFGPQVRRTPDQKLPVEGRRAPELNVRGWMNAEKPLRISDLEGKVVLVDFWATWCQPCIKSVPWTNAIADKYEDEGLVVVGVCHRQGAEVMPQVVEMTDMKYPTAIDDTGSVMSAYSVRVFPSYYVIDRQGRVVVADANRRTLESVIQRLLAQ